MLPKKILIFRCFVSAAFFVHDVNSTIQFVYDFFERKDTEFMVTKNRSFPAGALLRRFGV